jgi:dTDP-4-amino-4,6-dideoxygalactose transaminase
VTAHHDPHRPALLGGLPVRPQGPPVWPTPNEAVVTAIERAAREGAWGHYIGPYNDQLKDVLRRLHGVEQAWLCSSGTVAVELALRGLGVGPGDEVILAAYDFKANFTDVHALGALPVLVDLRPDDWQLNVELVAGAITPKTKAVIASHLHGGSVRMAQLKSAVGSIGIVEDACQCPGVTIDSRIAGTTGDVGVLSFGGTKLTSAGRGGAVVCNRQDIIERIKRHVMRGNDLSPLSELQAAALIPQWRQLSEMNAQRAVQARTLERVIAAVPGLRMLTSTSAETASGYYKIGFEYDASKISGLSRDGFCQAMRAEGIAFSAGFRGLHRIHASRRFRAAGPLSVADVADERMVVLHHPVLLGEDSGITEIAEALQKITRFAEELSRIPVSAAPSLEDCDE